MISIKETITRVTRDIKDYGLAVIILIVYTVLVNLIFHAFCPMVIMTGFPCPGCGLTRAFLYLATGRVRQSIQINPLGIPIVCIFIYFCFNRYILGRKAKWLIQLIGIAVACLLILYVWRMYNFFPSRAPYVYSTGNVFERIFPYYKQILYDLGVLCYTI